MADNQRLSDAKIEALFLNRFGPETRAQCKVCWYVYDPKEGSIEWQIPPGTPFKDLPEHFSCPNCGSEKAMFLPLEDH